MLRKRFYQAIDDLFANIQVSQDQAISEAAEICSEAVANGHSIHLYDTGHIIDSELFNRVGGFNLIRQFKYNLNLTSTARVQAEHEDEKDRNLEGFANFALKSANIYPGDVLFIGSVSGISFHVVDLALAANKLGIKVIALTSVEFSKFLETLHPSGKKLYELADVLVDNCAPIGDGMLEVDGVKQKFAPASGLSSAYIMWAIMSDLLENLLAKGLSPGILGSVNYPPNVQTNLDMEELYKEKGL